MSVVRNGNEMRFFMFQLANCHSKERRNHRDRDYIISSELSYSNKRPPGKYDVMNASDDSVLAETRLKSSFLLMMFSIFAK